MDAKRGSKRYKELLAMRSCLGASHSRLIYMRPWEKLKLSKPKNLRKDGWLCWEPGAAVTSGYGLTKNDAFVDFMEEVEWLWNFLNNRTISDYKRFPAPAKRASR